MVPLFQAVMMILWAGILYGVTGLQLPYLGVTCSYLPYVFVTILSFVCFYQNKWKKTEVNKTSLVFVRIASVIFSGMVVLANYDVWYLAYSFTGSYYLNLAYTIVSFLVLSVGGYLTIYQILYCTAGRIEAFTLKKCTYSFSPTVVFLVCFGAVSIFNIVILFTCCYPGVLSPDSITQIQQGMTGVYSNHHPFYHTMVIQLLVKIGLWLFGNMNAAVALYSVVQILFMAACFSAVAVTLYEMKVSMKLLLPIMLWYLLMPFHIMYSFTMWKDVSFGGFMVLFTVYMYRCLKQVGRHRILDLMILFVSGLGMCLFRSNGFFVFVLVAAAFFFLYRKEKGMCAMFLGIIVIAFVMKHIVLGALGVTQPDIVEHLSIPEQQIARVMVEHHDLTEEQSELLSQVIDLEKVPEEYLWFTSDPIKNLIRNQGKVQYLSENKLAFLKCYLELGLRHPWTYVKAWVDETKGFWNSEYRFWYWENRVYENPYGIYRISRSEFMTGVLGRYLQIFVNSNILRMFLSIGFHSWIAMYLFFISIIRRDKAGIFLSLPILVLVLSLLVSTPMFAEFRYVYGMFCSLPFVAVAAFWKKEDLGSRV